MKLYIQPKDENKSCLISTTSALARTLRYYVNTRRSRYIEANWIYLADREVSDTRTPTPFVQLRQATLKSNVFYIYLQRNLFFVTTIKLKIHFNL